MLVGAPFYASELFFELPFIILGALILVAIAALANPHNASIFNISSVVSGAGATIYQIWALYAFSDSTWVQFILREVIAIVFLGAYYFSLKTLRAFILHQVGKHEEVGEFEEPAPTRGSSWAGEFMPWFLQNNHKNGAAPNADDEGPRLSPGRKPEEIKPKSHPYEETM